MNEESRIMVFEREEFDDYEDSVNDILSKIRDRAKDGPCTKVLTADKNGTLTLDKLRKAFTSA